ncbi:MAG: hypothetical protein IKD80_06470 [Selenomonadaceae bacterium]|nr:hypothetical protein [Selenomonadaceae bacterium]
MKKFFLLAVMMFVAVNVSTVQANSMPREEMCVGGVGYGCMFSYVKEVFGEPLERRTFDGVDVHGCTWFYSPQFSVTGRTFGNPVSEEITVVAFSLKDDSLTLPDGLTVGMSYNEVVKRWGRGELYEYDGRRCYFYVPNDSDIPMTLSFYVDDAATITEIELGTDF